MVNIDREWIDKACQGDDEAFTKLVETYQNPVYNMCYRMLGEAGAAEDAAQETFWRAYQNLKRYDPQRSFITWILSIAAHYCIDQQRKRRLSLFELDEFPDFDLGDPKSSHTGKTDEFERRRFSSAQVDQFFTIQSTGQR